jgi:protein involved in polysaccharide export with SLBB domain
MLGFPATAQVLTQQVIQSELGQMLLGNQLTSEQPSAVLENSTELPSQDGEALAPVEELDAISANDQRPKSLSASQLYFKSLLGEDLQPFGLSEFKNSGNSELLLFNAISEEYKLSAGDSLQVVIRGLYPATLSVVIDRNGAVALPQFLPTPLAGLTVDQAASQLSEMIQMNDASARVSVVVTSARLIPVQMGGMVRTPQVLAIPAYTPLSLALARSGGLQPDASLRSVRLLSQEGGARSIDLYGLLLGEEEFREPLLTEGARVFVPPAGGSIAITGLVPRHGIFELGPEEDSITIADALKLSGLSLIPQGLPLERVFFGADGLPMSVIVTDVGKDRLRNGEGLRVGFLKTAPQGNINVLGSVIEPFSRPFSEGIKLSEVLKGGAVLSPSADGDFVVLMFPKGSDPEPLRLIALKELLSGAVDPTLSPGAQVLVPSKGQVTDILKSVAGEAVSTLDSIERSVADEVLIAEPAQVFIDGKIVALVPDGVETGLIDRLVVALARRDIYAGYALVESDDGSLLSLGLGSLEDGKLTQLRLERGTKLHVFSRQFVTSVVRNKVNEDVLKIESDEIATVPQLDEKLYRRMVADSRLVTGEVSEPGAYPFTGKQTLDEVLSAAGGILPSGDEAAVVVRQYRVDGSVLSLEQERFIDTTLLEPSSVVLDGVFGVTVQPLINDAFVGTVTVGGEVRRPGAVAIMRGDTISDVLARAGGLTATAYPLGAVLSRAALIEGERSSNIELAKQLRASVLLASEDTEAGSENTARVLDFAQQLEGSRPTGRQVVDILDASFVLMESGDRLVVPKRPSHVRIIGAVYSEVAALYREGASPIDYVEDAGGLTRFADPRRSFMILPNGQSLPINLRRKGGNADVPPGSVIVVPPKVDRVSGMQLTETLSRALGSIAASVLAIDVLSGQ